MTIFGDGTTPLCKTHVETLARSMAKADFPTCLCLFGDLGAGKSTFSRAYIRSFLEDEEALVPSPTFTLVQVYEKSERRLYHADLYRLKDAREIETLGLLDAFGHATLIIEWPELFPPLMPRTEIYFTWMDEHHRCLSIKEMREESEVVL